MVGHDVTTDPNTRFINPQSPQLDNLLRPATNDSLNPCQRAVFFGEFLHAFEDALSIGLGLSMAFSAGYANGVCLSGFLNVDPEGSVKQSVAGVTGLYTNSAIFIGEREFHQASFMFGTIFSVMGGAFLSALLNPYPIAFEISPRYGLNIPNGSILYDIGCH